MLFIREIKIVSLNKKTLSTARNVRTVKTSCTFDKIPKTLFEVINSVARNHIKLLLVQNPTPAALPEGFYIEEKPKSQL